MLRTLSSAFVGDFGREGVVVGGVSFVCELVVALGFVILRPAVRAAFFVCGERWMAASARGFLCGGTHGLLGGGEISGGGIRLLGVLV